MNRLKLDFTLNSTAERTAFLKDYLQNPDFQKHPLSNEEIETCSNYILWGKDKDGKNAVQRKEIEIETRHKTWNPRKEEESLEALLETPTFNEQTILPPTEAVPRHKREIFNRQEALSAAPPEIQLILKELFYEIDSLDLLLTFYDLRTGKRTNPPREKLLQSISPIDQKRLEERSQHLNQFQYLKLRHLLVEKRKEQYTLKDTYSSALQSILPPPNLPPEHLIIGEDVPVFPLGIKHTHTQKLFPNYWDISLTDYTEKDLECISDILWSLREKRENLENKQYYFSFLDESHVYQLLLMYLEFSYEEEQIESLAPELLETLEYYIEMADLSDIQKEILELKIQKKTNQEIVSYINQKYNRSYTVNYISTIFTQQIVKKITAAAVLHEVVMENIFFPENFKKCSRCGAMLLKDAEFFMRKSRSSDGFSSRCKNCDREIRGGYKKT